MSLWKHPERTILLIRVVQMNADCKHLFQRVRRCVGTNYTLFYRPRPPALGISTLAQGQRCVLMPHHQPVRRERLVKQGCWERNRVSAEDMARDSEQS